MLLLMDLAALFDSVWSWSLVALGIGLVIFVHELGHFVVAKRCGVRCEVFSLGFGPRVLGLRRGDTDYRISLVPIGGYVKMAGDNPGEDLDGAADELPSKSVGQRFAIFSAGVVMNVIFAAIVLPIVLAIGVPFDSTVVGSVEKGGAAWRAGIREGDELLRVGGHDVYSFDDVIVQVALGDPDALEIELRAAGADQVTRRTLDPDYDAAGGLYRIGIGSSLEPWLEADPDGPAAALNLTKEDRIVAFDGEPIHGPEDFIQACVANLEEQVTLRVRRADGSIEEHQVEARAADEERRSIGVILVQSRVDAVRGVCADVDFLEADDELVAIRPLDEGTSTDEWLEVRDSGELETALQTAFASERPYGVVLQRSGRERTIELPLGRWRASGVDAAQVAADVALDMGSRQTEIRLSPGYPAEAAGLPEGGVLVEVDGTDIDTWDDLRAAVGRSEGEPLAVVVQTDGGRETFRLTPRVDLPRPDVGLHPVRAMVERRYGVVEAVQVGLAESAYMLKNVYVTLKKIFSRDVSPKNLSGILTIAVVSKSFADLGTPRLFFFLAVLSLNLAFLNVLPIPVLDGGHLLFLLVEKVKGSPVSERVMGYSQMVGLVMVLALLLYVTYNDILRVLG